MSEQEKAREKARLLLEWADEKTLQQLGKPGQWNDYTAKLSPTILDPSRWRIKPEPRRKWETGSASIGGDCYSATYSEKTAAEWKSRGYSVTEWQEVLP
jgi:hypothetical protein